MTIERVGGRVTTIEEWTAFVHRELGREAATLAAMPATHFLLLAADRDAVRVTTHPIAELPGYCARLSVPAHDMPEQVEDKDGARTRAALVTAVISLDLPLAGDNVLASMLSYVTLVRRPGVGVA